ncbi:hypothetical protein PBS_12100 [Paraburkholderia sp. 2C]
MAPPLQFSRSNGQTGRVRRSAPADLEPATQTGKQPETGATAALKGATETELKELLAAYDPELAGGARDDRNGQLSSALQDVTMRGYPADARQLEGTIQDALTRTSQLLPDERDFYNGILAAVSKSYARADQTSAQQSDTQDTDSSGSNENTRTRIWNELSEIHDAIVDRYNQTINDPALRVQAFFNAPVGNGFLRQDKQDSIQKLEGMRDSFNRAKTAEDRKKIFQEAGQLKLDLQNDIEKSIQGRTTQEQTDWDAAGDKVKQNLRGAENLQGEKIGALDRLEYFGRAILADERTTRAFADMYQQDPNDPLFNQIRNWDQQAFESNREANKKLPQLPPASFLDVFRLKNLPPTDENYGRNLLQQLQDIQSNIVATHKGVNMSQLHDDDPIKVSYLRSLQANQSNHPMTELELQGQVAEGLCRFNLGAIPIFGSMIADQVCPRSTMSDGSRAGVDVASGVFWGALSEGRIGGRGTRIELGASGAGSTAELRPAVKSSLPEPQVHIPVSARLKAALASIMGRNPSLPPSYAYREAPSMELPTPTPGILKDGSGKTFIKSDGKYFSVKKIEDKFYVYNGSNPWSPDVEVRYGSKGWGVASDEAAPASSSTAGGDSSKSAHPNFDICLKQLQVSPKDYKSLIPEKSSQYYRADNFPVDLAQSYPDMEDRLAAILRHTSRTSGSAGEVQSFTSKLSVARRFADARHASVSTVQASEGMFMSAGEIIMKYGDMLVRHNKITLSTLRSAIEQFVKEGESEFFWLGKQYKGEPLTSSIQLDALFTRGRAAA